MAYFSYVDFSYFSISKINSYYLVELNPSHMSYNNIYTTIGHCNQ